MPAAAPFLTEAQLAHLRAHVHVHVVDVDVAVAGRTVRPGDLVRADQHRAVVMPAGAAAQLAEATDRLAGQEAVVIEGSRHGFGYPRIDRILAGGRGGH